MIVRKLTTLIVLAACSTSLAYAAAFDKSMLITTSDTTGKTEKINGILRVERDKIEFDSKKGGTVFSSPFADVTKLVYERTKKPRYSAGLLLAWPLLFTKEKQHYLTVEAEGKFAFVKLHKKHFRSAIAAVESSSGKSVERLEE